VTAHQRNRSASTDPVKLDSFDRAAGWLYEGMAKAFGANTARLAIVGDNPMLLSGENAVEAIRVAGNSSLALAVP
jgi:aminopeptidase